MLTGPDERRRSPVAGIATTPEQVGLDTREVRVDRLHGPLELARAERVDELLVVGLIGGSAARESLRRFMLPESAPLRARSTSRYMSTSGWLRLAATIAWCTESFLGGGRRSGQ
jgi:hypothetical protein